MTDDEISELFARAGMLMEDAAGRLVMTDEGIASRTAVLINVVHCLVAILDEVRPVPAPPRSTSAAGP